MAGEHMTFAWWMKPGPHTTPAMRPSWQNRRQMDLRQPGWDYCQCGAVRSYCQCGAVRSKGGSSFISVQIGGVSHSFNGCGPMRNGHGAGTIYVAGTRRP